METKELTARDLMRKLLEMDDMDKPVALQFNGEFYTVDFTEVDDDGVMVLAHSDTKDEPEEGEDDEEF